MVAKRILIVDDEPNIGLSLKMILEGEGYNVVVCRSAVEFRARVTLSRTDACLLDVRLPDGNGIDLLRLLRQNDNRVPVIMISGHGTIADAVEATRAGAFDFLEKPLGRERVLVVVKNALEQGNLRRVLRVRLVLILAGLAVLITVAVLLRQRAQSEDPSAAERAIREVLDAQVVAWNRGDLEWFLDHMTEDFEFRPGLGFSDLDAVYRGKEGWSRFAQTWHEASVPSGPQTLCGAIGM